MKDVLDSPIVQDLAHRAVKGTVNAFKRRMSHGGRRVRRPRYPAMAPMYRGVARYGGFYNRYAPAAKELKFFDQEIAFTSFTYPEGGILKDSICVIPAGTGESERIGRYIHIKKIQFKFDLRLLAGNGFDDSTFARIVVYLDKQCNGATATWAQLYKNVGPDWMAQRNLENVGRFRVLKDKTFRFQPTAGCGDGTTNFYMGVRYMRRMTVSFKKPLRILYSGVTGALTEICCNNIGIAMVGESAKPAVSALIRVRYTG